MKFGTLLLAATGLLAIPAIAQPPLGSRLDPTPGAVQHQDPGDQVTARRVMRAFAACMMTNKARVAAEILLQRFGSDAQEGVINQRVAGVHDCMGESGLRMGFNARALAGALAEAGLRQRFARTDLGRVSRLNRDEITLRNLDPRNGYEELGLCVARRAPDAVRAWALSEPGSQAEAAARRAVIPEVGPCVDQGQPLRADVVALRAILSAALYRAIWQTR